MKAEKIVISFMAVVIGILVASLAFYLYQRTKVLPETQTKVATSIPPPSPTGKKPSIFLSLDTPKDEDVVDTKTVTISGKTNADATVVVITDADDMVVAPASNGNFSTTATIGNGTNKIEITAISPDGEETMATRTVTYSTESF